MSLPLFLAVFITAPLMTMLVLWWHRAHSALVLLPFVWIILSPIVTIPMQAHLLGSILNEHCAIDPWGGPFVGEGWACPVHDAIPTLLPGLINLVPLAWMILPDRSARYAGALAGMLGLLRLSVPMIVYAQSAGSEAFPERVILSQSGHYAWNNSLIYSGFLWAVTLFALAMVVIVMAQSRSRDLSSSPATGAQNRTHGSTSGLRA